MISENLKAVLASMRNPRILFMNRVYTSPCGTKGRGASGRVLRDLARSFAEDGWDVQVLTSGTKAEREDYEGVSVIRVRGAEKPGLFGYIWVWIKLFFRAAFMRKPDVIVTMTDPPMLVVAGDILSRIKKTKHIHWCQDVYPDVFPALGYHFPKFVMKWMKLRAVRAMKRADKVIVIGRCMARVLGYGGVETSNMAVVPNWPDTQLVGRAKGSVKSDFEKAPHHSGKARVNTKAIANYRAPEDQKRSGPKFRVLYAGNIGRAHPIDTILDAAAILNDDYPEIEFVFVGDGPRYERLARERGKRHLDNIRLLPFQPVNRLRGLMESGDLHLISMNDAAAGMIVPSKMYAALAVGRPCVFVGPEACEVSTVLRDFKAGDVVASGDAKALAECILAFRMDGDKWFAAKDGAVEAGKTFVPKEAMQAWIRRARKVAGLGEAPSKAARSKAA